MAGMQDLSVHARVPHSVGTNRPSRTLPALACDSHMHIFDARFAPSPHWPRTPPDAPVAAYRQLQQRLGTSRTVVVTPSTYGTDNACTLDALDQLGDSARGVAVVDAEVDDRQLAELAARRVRGLRVNFVSPQSWGTTTPEMLATLAGKVARHADCAGWHIQVFAQPEQIVALAPSRIVYVACDPAALARDIAYLAKDGYELESVRAFDLFPMTHHVECVAVLTR